MRMSRPPVLKRHEAAMNTNNDTPVYTTPRQTPEPLTPPKLQRKNRVTVRKIVDFTARKKMRNFLERPDTDHVPFDGLAAFARLAAQPAPDAEPAPAAGADNA